jgi:hypothetical protein
VRRIESACFSATNHQRLQLPLSRSALTGHERHSHQRQRGGGAQQRCIIRVPCGADGCFGVANVVLLRQGGGGRVRAAVQDSLQASQATAAAACQ